MGMSLSSLPMQSERPSKHRSANLEAVTRGTNFGLDFSALAHHVDH
jgi:hypothetical protein